MKGGLTRSDGGENSDQRREGGRRPPPDDVSVTEEKMQTPRRGARGKGQKVKGIR